MHSSSPHRVRIVAGHHAHNEPRPATSAAQFRRQGELFRRLHARAHANACQAEQASDETSDAPCDVDASDGIDRCADLPDETRGGSDGERGERGEDDKGDDDAQQSESTENVANSTPDTSLLALASYMPNVAALHGVHAARRSGTSASARASEASAPVAPDMPRLVECIATQVADFCSNPTVLERGDWHITVPLDPALLPNCTLSVTFSRFTVTLRFDTSEERSATLISQHIDTLRKGIEQVMRDRVDTSRSIEIIVM